MAKKRRPNLAKKKASQKKKAPSKKKAAATRKPTPKAKAAPRAKRRVPIVGAALARAAAGPPYKCQTTLEPGVCLRFNRNPDTGQYNLPPGGIRVSCTECEYFF
jgi:hypothetical protein